MSALTIPWAKCRDVTVSAAAAAGRGDADRKWYRCLECNEPLSYVKAYRRINTAVDVRAHFKHQNKTSLCGGGGLMTYVHRATQDALCAFSGEVLICCDSGDCKGVRAQVHHGRRECAKVKPFTVDVALETSLGDVAVEVTKTHKTEEQKWSSLVGVYGEAMVCEVDVSRCVADADGKFEIVFDGVAQASVCESKLVLHNSGFSMLSRQQECAACKQRQHCEECECLTEVCICMECKRCHKRLHPGEFEPPAKNSLCMSCTMDVWCAKHCKPKPLTVEKRIRKVVKKGSLHQQRPSYTVNQCETCRVPIKACYSHCYKHQL